MKAVHSGVLPSLGHTLVVHDGDRARHGILSNLNPVRVMCMETGAEESFPTFARGCAVTVEPSPVGHLGVT